MNKIKYSLLSIVLGLAIVSCAQEETTNEVVETKVNSDETLKAKAEQYKKQHRYGGWYCPDNFGFAPVDIQLLDQVPAISDRLPTEEEARNGSSLMYIDTTEYPEAYALEMDLPRTAKIYSSHKGMSELIIVIQAVVIGEDTIVGYRFPSGGNGSAWLGQISFLSDGELEELGSQPMIYKKTEIKASKEEIWKFFTQSEYAQELGERFTEEEFFSADWTGESGTHLYLGTNDTTARGWVSNHFGNIYLHIDYMINGQHYAEKMLIGNPNDEGYAELHFAAGPYLQDASAQDQAWDELVSEIEEISFEN